jgi:hypothetical protein
MDFIHQLMDRGCSGSRWIEDRGVVACSPEDGWDDAMMLGSSLRQR